MPVIHCAVSFFQILSLPNSKFYHIGTMSEYIDALCGDSQLAAELSFGERSKSGVVMCSIVTDSLRVPANVVIEFCKGRYSVKSRIIKQVEKDGQLVARIT